MASRPRKDRCSSCGWSLGGGIPVTVWTNGIKNGIQTLQSSICVEKYVQMCPNKSTLSYFKILWNSAGIRSARGTVQPDWASAGDGLGIKLSVGVDQTANLRSWTHWTLTSQRCESLGHWVVHLDRLRGKLPWRHLRRTYSQPQYVANTKTERPQEQLIASPVIVERTTIAMTLAFVLVLPKATKICKPPFTRGLV